MQPSCSDNSLLPPKGKGLASVLVAAQPASLSTKPRRKPGKEQFFHAVTQAQGRRVGVQDRREGIPPRKGLLRSAGPSNPSSVVQELELNSGEQVNTLYVSSPVCSGWL